MPNAPFNPAVKTLSPPPIPVVQQWGNRYTGKHGPLLDLSQAVPGYPPHPSILQTLGETAQDPAFTGYGNIEGEDILREAYADHISALYKTSASPENIHITSGCNQAFIAAMMAIAGNGDSILLSNPFYFNHESTLDMLGITVRTYETDPDNGFIPDLSSITDQLDDRVKAIVLISPNNPTGAIYPDDLLQKIFSLCREKGIWMVLDETYRDFLPLDDSIPHVLLTHKNWEQHFIQLYSFSKSFCIPGQRLGAVLAGKGVIEQIAKVMDNLQICAPRTPQIAVAKTLEHLAGWREENRKEIARRAKTLISVLSECPAWQIKAIGAYFAYVEHPFSGISSVGVAEKLASLQGVTCIPGAFFGRGQEPYLRLAFANVSVDELQLLKDRLNSFSL